MDFINSIVDGINYLLDWLQNGIYVFFEDWFKEAVAWFVIAQIKFKIWAVQFSWEVAKTIMLNLNIGGLLQSGFNQVDPVLLGYLNYFRVPESINLIVQALLTRLTLAVMGW